MSAACRIATKTCFAFRRRSAGTCSRGSVQRCGGRAVVTGVRMITLLMGAGSARAGAGTSAARRSSVVENYA